MKLVARLAILALVATPLGAIAAFGDSSPQVEMAIPGIGGGAIERFTVRFTQPMVPLGDPRAASPFEVECPVAGEGRWVDQTTFVHEFAGPLPGGVTCSFKFRPKLRSLAGYEVTGQSEFKVDSGGPIARAVLPSRYGGTIEEDQVFLVAANMGVDRASVSAGAYCAVDGLGEKIPVDVLGPDVAPKLLADLGTDRWEVRSFLEEAGLPQALPAAEADRVKATESITALKCRRPLPPGRDVSLVWGKGIKSPSGRLAGADQRFDFEVRKPFAARFECSRVNPQAGCSPVEAAWVRFTAPIARADAQAIRLKLPDGKELVPELTDKNSATVDQVRFKPPLAAAVTAKLVLPANLTDESKRALSNAERFPLDVKFDEPPPLAKFAAPFGILELKEGGGAAAHRAQRRAQAPGRAACAGGPDAQGRRPPTARSQNGCAGSTTRRQQVRRGQARQGDGARQPDRRQADPDAEQRHCLPDQPRGRRQGIRGHRHPADQARILCRRSRLAAAGRGAARAPGDALRLGGRAGDRHVGCISNGAAKARSSGSPRFRAARAWAAPRCASPTAAPGSCSPGARPTHRAGSASPPGFPSPRPGRAATTAPRTR